MASRSSRLHSKEFDDPHFPSHEFVANPLAFENIPLHPPSPQNSQSHYIGSNHTLEIDDFLLNNQPRNQRLANNFDLNHQDLHEYIQLLNAHMQLLAINQQIPGGSINNDYGGTVLMRPSNPLRRRHRISIPLQDLRGQVVLVARDPQGCQFLMKKLDEGNPQEIEFILREVEGHLHELMMDHDGNDLVQKIFEAISVVQMDSIVSLIIRDENKFMNVCINYHGSQAVQKLVEHLTTLEQSVAFTNALMHIIVPLAKNLKGGFVIQKCLEVFPIFVSSIIWNEIASNCVNIARDKSGCSVLQNCLSNAKGASMLLVRQIILAASVLSQDPYGNYVVQYLITTIHNGWINAAIAQQLRRKYVELCMNKFASNVVENLIRHCDENDVVLIIQEIMNNPSFLYVVLDPYGNYVVQSALKNSQSMIFVHETLLNRIMSNYEYLRNDPYGKRVLASARACRLLPHVQYST